MTNAAHMPHITHYKCVSAAELEKLQTDVETEIHNGWQPYGFLAAIGGGEDVSFVQPMVRYAEFYR